MSKTTKFIVLALSFLIVSFVIVGGLGGVKADSKDDGSYRQLGVYSEVLSRIRTEYVEEPNISAVTNGALHGLLESLDANSSYLDPAEFKDYKQRKEGKAGIGAAVSKRYGYAAVIAVVPGGPADKSDIASGDIIEAIEGKSTRDMSLAEIDGRLTGPPGSVVNLSVVRPRRAQPVKSAITLAVVTDPPPNDKMMQDGIGYIKVDGFPKGRSQEISNKLKALQKEGAKKVILDLRNSGDGDENEGVATANLFLNHGTITYLQGQKYPKQTFNADPQKAIMTNVPLVVLVNRGTAGPAEIVAGAIMENARGDVVGDKTFGSGSIQKIIDMPDGSALILSVAKYYSPSGKAVQDTAITPNVLIADSSDDFIAPDEDENAEDEAQEEKQKANQPDDQLNKAIEVLKTQTTKS